jgi:hypothetical protein
MCLKVEIQVAQFNGWKHKVMFEWKKGFKDLRSSILEILTFL